MTSIGSKSSVDETCFSPLKKCKCGSMLKVQTAETTKSYGRRFISCPNTWGGIGGCKLFRWIDMQKESSQSDNEETVQPITKVKSQTIAKVKSRLSLEQLTLEIDEVKRELHNSSEIVIKHMSAIRTYCFVICIMLMVIISKMFV
ncbi:hypothetical protein ACFE04_027124 [Oxalis oulophora]